MNPCTGSANSVSWVAIDGAGGTIARTAPCFSPATKEIIGFWMQFDSGDFFAHGAVPDKFDIQATTAHEAGHAVGLDHPRAPRAAVLTMFPFLSLNATFMRTLGCGDLLGVNRAYGTGFDCAAFPTP